MRRCSGRSSVGLLVALGWSLWSWKRLTGSVFDPYGLFLIAAFVFNAGSAFLYVFGLNTAGIMILDFSFSPAVTLQTLLLVFLGLGGFHLGALVVASGQAGGLFPGPVAVHEESPTAEQIRFVGWALLIVSALPMLLLLKQSVTVVLNAGYFALVPAGLRDGLAGEHAVPRQFPRAGRARAARREPAFPQRAARLAGRDRALRARAALPRLALPRRRPGDRLCLALAPRHQADPARPAARRGALRLPLRLPGGRRDARHERRGPPRARHAARGVCERQQPRRRHPLRDGRHDGDGRAHPDLRARDARLRPRHSSTSSRPRR